MNIIKTLSIIDKLEKECYKPPETYAQKRSIFIYQSYKRSAIEEIKKYLKEHKKENPITALEEFRCKMDYYACKTENGNANFMFSVYYDIATDVLDTLIWNMVEKERR